MEKECLFCKKTINKLSAYCSIKCKDSFAYYNKKRKDHQCKLCKKICYSEKLLCQKCASSIGLKQHRFKSGSKNPAWKGGFKYWSDGRFGRDKDGLSWCQQKKAVFKRDGYKCVTCGEILKNRKPDVHHISPWKESKSHSLKNLISLCKSCHKKEDIKAQTMEG